MTYTVTNTVGDWREKKGITQEALARALSVSRQTVIAVERGKYVPSLPLALQVAKDFGTTIDRIFTLP